MAKQRKNLFLDAEAVRRGERYSEVHRTNLSQLVSDFLAQLPLDTTREESPFSPTVRRLYGIGAGQTKVEDYREHLAKKYES